MDEGESFVFLACIAQSSSASCEQKREEFKSDSNQVTLIPSGISPPSKLGFRVNSSMFHRIDGALGRINYVRSQVTVVMTRHRLVGRFRNRKNSPPSSSSCHKKGGSIRGITGRSSHQQDSVLPPSLCSLSHPLYLSLSVHVSPVDRSVAVGCRSVARSFVRPFIRSGASIQPRDFVMPLSPSLGG